MAGLKWYGPEVERVIYEAGGRGIGEGADQIAETSQDKVPVQTGELKRSQGVHKDGLHAVVHYDDNKAAAAHENVHGYTYRNGKQAKFLELAAQERRDDVLQTVAEHIRSVL